MWRRAKIVLSVEPERYSECPFCNEHRDCFFTKSECQCVSGCYDSMTFEFKKCPYCTTFEITKHNV